MKQWNTPLLKLYPVCLSENIAASGSVGWFWYTGQGYGNEDGGNFYYTIQGNKTLVSDTVLVGGNNNIQKHDVEEAVKNCLAN